MSRSARHIGTPAKSFLESSNDSASLAESLEYWCKTFETRMCLNLACRSLPKIPYRNTCRRNSSDFSILESAEAYLVHSKLRISQVLFKFNRLWTEQNGPNSFEINENDDAEKCMAFDYSTCRYLIQIDV